MNGVDPRRAAGESVPGGGIESPTRGFSSEYGKQLGKGLFEFRLRRSVEEVGERILLRIFCHAYGNSVVLLLGGYDKGADRNAVAAVGPGKSVTRPSSSHENSPWAARG